MCQQGCRTFAWGGMGVPTHDGDGGCFCACESDSWSNLNILGLPSCVPVKAHLLFGWFGLVISVVTLSHAAYHFRRQVCNRFDDKQISRQAHSLENSCLSPSLILTGILGASNYSAGVTRKAEKSSSLWTVPIPTSLRRAPSTYFGLGKCICITTVRISKTHQWRTAHHQDGTISHSFCSKRPPRRTARSVEWFQSPYIIVDTAVVLRYSPSTAVP